MKIKFVILLLSISFYITNAQMKPIKVTLKNGEIYEGVGKQKSSSFKFKKDEESKPAEFLFSAIDKVEIKLNDIDVTTFNFYQTTESDDYVSVIKIISNSKTELYTPSRTVGGGSFGNGMGTVGFTATYYYVKTTTESRLTVLGRYDPLISELRNNTLKYFSDCKELIEKIKNKEFKFRDGVEEIVKFYNNSCK